MKRSLCGQVIREQFFKTKTEKQRNTILMLLDGHIHIFSDQPPDPAGLRRRLQSAGISGGVILSLSPHWFRKLGARRRLDNLCAWTRSSTNLFPFYWIDPLEDDALEQVQLAMQRGVKGFKIICDRFFPHDPRALRVILAIAAARRPILFHSGILWDGQPSSRYNRPAEFEPLMEVKNLTFCLAHLSWPWCDELIALYGKILNARVYRPDVSATLFVDVTPGTPVIYRREVLTRLFKTGYDVNQNVIFGTDCSTNNYNVAWAKAWIARDRTIYRRLKLSTGTQSGIFAENLKRFLGISRQPIRLAPPKCGE